MPSFLVTWSIDIDADTPQEAARIAREMHLDPDSIATVFDVQQGGAEAVRVDLGEPEWSVAGQEAADRRTRWEEAGRPVEPAADERESRFEDGDVYNPDGD